ncbi:MAG: PKD domain-containing protein, partial [bacterium]
GTLLGSVTNRSPGYLEIDVTPFIQQEAQGDGIASFEISNDASGWRRYSALNGSFAPMLRISTAGSLPPAPENQAPTARFTISPSTSTAPATLSFDASESSDLDGSIVGYAWDFGDGSNGNGISVSHHYSQAGDYTVMLEVSDNAGSTSQSSQTYRLGTDTGPTTPPPATGSNTLVPTQDVGASGKGQSETLNASRWDHGFLQFDLNAIPRPVNSATLRLFYLDTLPIDVTIKPTLGNDWSEASGGPAKNRSSDQNIQGSISNPGYIELDLSTLTNALQDADPRLSIELSNNSSGWRRFGSRESSTPPQLQLSYEGATPPSPNTPPPATNAPPVATIASDVSSAEAPATVTFDATQSSDSDGTIVAYQWDFGDETGSNEPVVTHQFSIARLYSITLTVTDDKGATHTASTSLSITAATPPPGSGGNG